MAHDRPRSFLADFRLFFVKGLGVVLPSVLTLWILIYAAIFVQRSVAEPINAGARQIVIYALPQVVDQERLPDWFNVTEAQITQLKAERQRQARPAVPAKALRNFARARNLKEWWDQRWYLRIFGLIVAIILIYLAGRFLGGFIGRRIYANVESAFQRLPVVAQIYPHVKQVVDVFFGSGEGERIRFNRVVLVEYPRRGIWTVGLLTGEGMKHVEDSMKTEGVTIFIPSSPTPFTGYTITVPRNEAIDLPITIDEALRFVVSGGVLVPPREVPDYVSRPGAMKDDNTPPLDSTAPEAEPGATGKPPHLADGSGDAMMKDSNEPDRPDR